MSYIKDIPLNAIVLDEAYQPREGLWPEHVDALVNSNPSEWPPVLVKPLPDGNYCMIDGFHRYKAAEVLGEINIKAEIDDVADVLTAYEANLKHGMPLTTAERKDYALLLHQRNPQLSYREIGRRAGLHGETVKAVIEPPVAENRQEAGSSVWRDNPDALEKLFRFIRQGYDKKAGVNFWSWKSDERQRAEAVKACLERYEGEEQHAMLAAVQAIGQAMVDGARLLMPQKK